MLRAGCSSVPTCLEVDDVGGGALMAGRGSVSTQTGKADGRATT